MFQSESRETRRRFIAASGALACGPDYRRDVAELVASAIRKERAGYADIAERELLAAEIRVGLEPAEALSSFDSALSAGVKSA